MLSRLLQKSISLVPWRWRSSVKRVRFLAPIQRWLLARSLHREEFIHRVDAGPARGLNYPVCLPQDKGVWTGTYEVDFATAIATATKPGSVCYDIGGWRGFFGGVMALAGAERVYIFEPLPENTRQINRVIQLNPKLPLHLIEAAVSQTSGELEFQMMPETSMGKLASSNFQPERRGRRITVRAVTIDDLVTTGQIKPPNLIKIDVEGAELMALRGSERTIVDCGPKLFMEVHSPDLLRDCISFLENRGFATRVLETRDRSSELRQICHLAAWMPKQSEGGT